jgi:hypothetical protein
VVTVIANGRAVVAQLGDWCACADRPGGPTLIDLDDDAFRALAPLSVGTLAVTVTPIPAPPDTSMEALP